MSLQCVILAGGEGTRMRPATNDLPKTMLSVGGKPFAHHQLSLLAQCGVERVLYSTGHKGQLIRDFVRNGRAWNLNVDWVEDGPTLRGTGGALRAAMDAGALEEEFLVLYGDSYLPIEMVPVEESFRRSGLPALMTVFHNRGQWDVSNVLLCGQRVELYDKLRRDARSASMEHIDYGLSVLTRDVIRQRIGAGERADLADVFHALSLEGQLAGHLATERFYEIGSAAGLAEFDALMRARAPHA